MKKYTTKLVDGTYDQYKIYTDNRGTMLCDDQLDDEFVKLSAVYFALEKCEGDMDLFKFLLPKSSFLAEEDGDPL